MNLSALSQKVLGRDRVIKMAFGIYRHGLVIGRPMHSLEPKRNHAVLEGEYIRSSSLELVAREIRERNVAGAVAEVGVYRGEFARLINVAFPDRKLYLFDTFAGFDNDQVREETAQGRVGSVQDFSQTSVDLVLSRMPIKENCVVLPGVFPNSAVECAEQAFAFVSIDCDLYQPIHEALKYFYPKLSSGGYIFVHDYNNLAYRGAKQAVREFAAGQAISYFPLSDPSGSAIFAKP